MVMRRILAPVNTVVYGGIAGPTMNDQLSAKDWLDQGLKALASRGFTALKAEPFAKATIQPESLRTLIRLVWQAGTVAWIGGGVLLIAAPSFGSESARHWIVVTIVAVYAFAAAANAWWSRGRGFGWKALGAVVVLAVAGY